MPDSAQDFKGVAGLNLRPTTPQKHFHLVRHGLGQQSGAGVPSAITALDPQQSMSVARAILIKVFFII
jgi:hypothetical protein